jgi:predicted Rossmann fold nucleotide-binding protein DprA/Smf involved in DNA uptake
VTLKYFRTIAIVGSRDFVNYAQLKRVLDDIIRTDDEFVSGGAKGVDSMAQRYAKEAGHNIHIYYPKYAQHGPGATFIRNKEIVEHSELVLAFYAKGRFQQGGTANSAKWARELNIELKEYEEE